jgi:hypothetical protein
MILRILQVLLLGYSGAVLADSSYGVIFQHGASATYLSADRYIGCDGDRWKFRSQGWGLNDMDVQRATLSGRIMAKARNSPTGNLVDEFFGVQDGDENICVPTNAYNGYLSINRWGDRTPSRDACGSSVPAGTVEAELKTDAASWLDQRLAPGTNVSVYGWWVYDMGHNFDENKPAEIHPISVMIIPEPSDLGSTWVHGGSIFAAQDLSGRFGVASWQLQESVNVLYQPSQRRTVTVGTESVTNIQSVNLLHESSLSQRMGAVMTGGQVSIMISLPPAGSCMCGDNCWYFDADPQGRFMYRADLSHSIPELLHEEADFAVVRDGNTGLDYGEVSLRLKLDNPLAGTWHYATYTTGSPNFATYETPDPQLDTQVFTWRYSPRDGYNQTTWIVDIAASTDSKNDLSSVDRTTSSSDPFGYERDFLGAQRTYELIPSQLALVDDEKTNNCVAKKTITSSFKLIPGTTLARSELAVRLSRDEQMHPANDYWHAFSSGAPYSTDTFTIGVKSNDPLVLVASFTPPHNQSYSNAALEVRWSGETNIGEWLSSIVTVRSVRLIEELNC